jgi:hypothetical protein
MTGSFVDQFYLRWALFWPDRFKYGLWGQEEPLAKDRASSNDLTGLVRAEIHAKKIGCNEPTNRMVICEGHTFKEFQFIKQVMIAVGSSEMRKRIVGLILVQKNGLKHSVYKDGTVIKEGIN